MRDCILNSDFFEHLYKRSYKSLGFGRSQDSP